MEKKVLENYLQMMRKFLINTFKVFFYHPKHFFPNNIMSVVVPEAIDFSSQEKLAINMWLKISYIAGAEPKLDHQFSNKF